MDGVRFIAGSGRSGTTWVQDALADANNLRPVFEPLHPLVSKIGAEYSHRALPIGGVYPDLEQFLAESCAGTRNPLWTRYRRQTRWLFPPIRELRTRSGLGAFYRQWERFLREIPVLHAASQRLAPLVKCIRANLMLGWLSTRCRARVVLILRHPAAVIESELRGKWTADFVLGRYRTDPILDEVTGGRYATLLSEKVVGVEALAIRWVIENQVALEQAKACGIPLFFYERLKSSPDREWPRLCKALDLERVPSESTRAKPSQQSARGAPSLGTTSTEPKWMSSISRDDAARIQGVLDRVEFCLYSVADPEPRNDTADSGPRQVRVMSP